MTVDEDMNAQIDAIFPGVILDPDPIDRVLLIRTDSWMIESDQLHALRQLGLKLDSIMVEGGSCITLIIDKETSRKVIKQ